MSDQTSVNEDTGLKDKVVNAVQSKIVADWRNTIKTYSVWVFASIIVSPELYDQVNALMSSIDADLGSNTLIPEPFKALLRLLGSVGLIFRFIRQTKQSIADAKKQLDNDRASQDQGSKSADSADIPSLGADPVQSDTR